MVRRIHSAASHVHCIALGLSTEGWRLIDASGIWITRIGRRFEVCAMGEETGRSGHHSGWWDSVLTQDHKEMQRIWEESVSVAKQDLPATWGG